MAAKGSPSSSRASPGRVSPLLSPAGTGLGGCFGSSGLRWSKEGTGGLEGVQQGAAEMGKGLGEMLGLLSTKNERVQRDLTACVKAWEGVKMEPGTSQRHPVTGQEAQADVQKILLKIKQNFSSCEDGQMLEWVTQRGWGINLGDLVQTKWTWH